MLRTVLDLTFNKLNVKFANTKKTRYTSLLWETPCTLACQPLPNVAYILVHPPPPGSNTIVRLSPWLHLKHFNLKGPLVSC